MMMLRRSQRRSGTVLVESAMVYPVVFLVMIGIMVLGIAVFRYQQVAHMAREGARYAAVHGKRYQDEGNGPAATAAVVFAQGIQPHAAGMQAANLTYAVAWNANNAQTSSEVVLLNGQKVLVTKSNTVSVTVTYSWNMPMFGTIPVSSTSVMTMCY